MKIEVAHELRRLNHALHDAEQRLARAILIGKVHDVNPQTRTLRLKLGESSDGAPVLSPWVRWREAGVGGLTIHSEPAIGTQMTLESPSGTIGTGSIASPASFDDDHPAPSKKSDITIISHGAGRIELGPNGIKFIGNVNIENGYLKHKNVDVGATHKHSGVKTGFNQSGEPVR